MKLVIGLGNVGSKYANTRHNLGFFILNSYLDYQDCENQWTDFQKFQSFICKLSPELLLAKPQTLMNNSGRVIKKLVDFYKVNLCDILIIQDDIDLKLGDFKLQFNRSSAGHKGVESVINSLGSQKFWRLRIGISRPPEEVASEEYVLQKFEKPERLVVRSLLPEIFKEVERWISSQEC